MGTVHSVLGRPEAQQNTYKSYFKILNMFFCHKNKTFITEKSKESYAFTKSSSFKETNKVFKNGRDHPTLLIKVCAQVRHR